MHLVGAEIQWARDQLQLAAQAYGGVMAWEWRLTCRNIEIIRSIAWSEQLRWQQF